MPKIFISLWHLYDREEIRDFYIKVENGEIKIYQTFYDIDEGIEITDNVQVNISLENISDASQ